MNDAGEDKEQRDRVIARNEAKRQAIGDIRVSTWAIGLAAIIAVIAVAIAWVWLSR